MPIANEKLGFIVWPLRHCERAFLTQDYLRTVSGKTLPVKDKCHKHNLLNIKSMLIPHFKIVSKMCK